MRMTTARKVRGVQNDWRFVCQQPVAAIVAGIRSGLRLRFADRPQCSSLSLGPKINIPVDFFRQIFPASPANCTAPIQGNRSCWQKTAIEHEDDNEVVRKSGDAKELELFPKWKRFKRRGFKRREFKRRGLGETGGGGV